MSKIKKLYAYIDIGCMNTISQSIQIRIIKLFAEQNNAKIVFLTNEDISSIKSQVIFKSKLNEKPKVDGFIFFSIEQLSYGKLNIKLIKKIFKNKYDLYFAKEEKIYKHNDTLIRKKIEEIIIFSYLKKKNKIYLPS